MGTYMDREGIYKYGPKIHTKYKPKWHEPISIVSPDSFLKIHEGGNQAQWREGGSYITNH